MVVFPDIQVILQQLNGPHEQVVEVNGVAAAQQFFIVVINTGGKLGVVIILHLGLFGQANGVHQQALGPGYDALDGPGRVAFLVHISHLHGLLDKAQLVIGVVDCVVGIEAHTLTVPAQHPGTEGVEGAGEDGIGIRNLQALDAVAHLPGRLVGEGDCGDAVGADVALPHQVGNAVGDHTGLAAAGAGHDEQRAFGGDDGFGLGIVQAFEEVGWVHRHNQKIIAWWAIGGKESGQSRLNFAGHSIRKFMSP